MPGHRAARVSIRDGFARAGMASQHGKADADTTDTGRRSSASAPTRAPADGVSDERLPQRLPMERREPRGCGGRYSAWS